MARDLPQVRPAPPAARARLPGVGSGLALLRDPTAFFARTRAELGDTFLVEAFGYRILCCFSPQGVQNLWALPEAQASKGLADFALLRHKVPDELFAGRRTRPHDLFARDDTAVHLRHVERAVAEQLEELGERGTAELFALTHRLGHRIGLASWGGLVGDRDGALDRLIPAFDRLDASESFVHPHRGIVTFLTGKRAERRALATLDRAFAEIVARRRAEPPSTPDLFDRICAAWSDEPSPAREVGIGRDVVLVHMGSMSNLFAAMAWTLVHVLERPELVERIRAGDEGLVAPVAYETIRLRQRSIVLRRVLAPLTFEDGNRTYEVEPGVFLATSMSVTNTGAAPGLDRFDPANFRGPRFVRTGELATPELVTTFGHGRHSCPAQVFSIEAIRIATVSLLARLELTPRFDSPQPLRRQLGGVARADRPCPVDYRVR